MKVLLLGSGGREHALAWALAKSPALETLFVAPGNAGIAQIAALVALDLSDHDSIIHFCREKAIDLVVIGPEAPLVAGLVDDLDAAGIRAFGPSRLAAQLEGSKGFTKDLCANYNIPTAAYDRFDNADAARNYVHQQGAPIVVKADGLAAGKGVIIAMTEAEAIAAIEMCFAGGFGEAGQSIVIEEFLEGEEISFFALCDGDHTLAFGSAQDHKRVGDGDTGPNTGGMGAYSPAPIMNEILADQVMATIIEPTVRAMRDMGHPYKGVLFAGLMITKDGPKLIEHNCRFGDPECQVLMMRLESDLLALIRGVVDGRLGNISVRWSDDAALTVVLAAEGYPGAYAKNTVISNLEEAGSRDGIQIFHAGTALRGGALVAVGGRVLSVGARGRTIAEAKARAYSAVDKIHWKEGFCRRDIGWRAIN
ncbi:MAG: phosphoribosylamine--glycine ligase [Rhizobiales bacterium]|nr:phosphoribosylamine--glycine ligase [Hyphomicrobiales bacterium]